MSEKEFFLQLGFVPDVDDLGYNLNQDDIKLYASIPMTGYYSLSVYNLPENRLILRRTYPSPEEFKDMVERALKVSYS